MLRKGGANSRTYSEKAKLISQHTLDFFVICCTPYDAHRQKEIFLYSTVYSVNDKMIINDTKQLMGQSQATHLRQMLSA